MGNDAPVISPSVVEAPFPSETEKCEWRVMHDENYTPSNSKSSWLSKAHFWPIIYNHIFYYA